MSKIKKTPDPQPPVDLEALSQAEAELAAARKELAWELAKAGVDAVGLVDPTPTADLIGASMSLYDGDYVGAGLSLISVIPFLGDSLAKTAKGARVTKAVKAAFAKEAAWLHKVAAIKNPGKLYKNAKEGIYNRKATSTKRVGAVFRCSKLAPSVEKIMELGGFTRAAAVRLIELSHKHGIVIRMRPISKYAKKWIEKGFPVKPVFIKNKTMDSIDELIGGARHFQLRLPDGTFEKTSSRGFAGHFEPSLPDESLKKTNPELYDEALVRYDLRKSEWLDEMRKGHLKKDIELGVIEIKDGLIIQKSSGKPYVGDNDIFDIVKKKEDGSEAELKDDSEEWQKIMKDLSKPPIEARHAYITKWKYQNQEEEELRAGIINRHADKGDIVEIRPDGDVGTYRPSRVYNPREGLNK